MALYELTDLSEFLNAAVNTQNRFDANWAIFLSINSAIIGGVVLIERVFNVVEKTIVIACYSMLSALSFLIASNAARQLRAIYTDISRIEFEPDKPGYHTVAHFKEIIDGDAFWESALLIPGIYLIAYIAVLSAVIFDEKFTLRIHKRLQK